jgi:anti-sigma B factor antagonist
MRHDATSVRLFSRRMPGHIVLTVRGELDVATTAGLRDQIAGIVDDATVPMIVDLSGVSYCDASGLAMLVGAQRRARLRGVIVAISEPSREVSELLCVNGLDHAFTMYPTLTAARRGLGRSSGLAIA